MTYNKTTYQYQKKYRESTREQYNLYQKILMIQYHEDNKEKINEKQRNKYSYTRECRTLHLWCVEWFQFLKGILS